ncbi:adenylate/guanylate cyclase domain-containing protein [Mesorhizobium sp. B2-3-5]|uniref:AAA family ATPase n=1 Tax=Mesorhizobium sp. B2-3-5 TaxID=2589958 RepID=UPI001128E5FC|nr:adenylate/guanylate cyclase domain-containing protein [Mesorhizobium sp. B2-3-5]TPM29184.1 adenylate/guanylate cyclase domain-containing protein [Mesorhizobium sp. B2-3-5]
MDIRAWLVSLGLGEYADAFGSQDIDEEVLPSLTADDLTALGVTSIGHRRKLLSAIAALAESPTRPTTAQPPPASSDSRAERRQLTVMFVDLVGSTELAQALDPEDMREVILAYQQVVAREIARYDGRVAKLMGDGVLAYFGWPQAHEDDAERAVRGGLAAVSATGRLAAPGGKPLAARVGIATGLVVVGDLVGEGAAQEEAVVGDTPNLAARLQALAEPGAVIIADTTQKLVAGLFVTADLGERLLKGFAAPVRCRRVVGETAAESRFEARHAVLAPLVGRDRELARLLERWHRATAAEGRVVLLGGEAGIGKSRLIAALAERVAAEPHAELRFFCSAYHTNSALHPLIAHLERAGGLVSDDSADSKFDKLRALLARLPMETDEALPLLAILLSIDPGGRYQPPRLPAPTLRARTLAALIRLVEASAANRPALVLVEDTHWIDPTTAEWLGMLVERLAGLRALLVVTARPEFEPRWTALSSVEIVRLGRLEQKHGIAIIERVAGNKKLPPDIADRILANTEGVPLFVEELTRTVLDSGLLLEADGRYLAIGSLPNLAIPSTLQDSLMARLDRLSPVKETAQIGACIGRIFGHRLLAAVSGTDQARLDDALHQLEQAELVFRSGIAPEATYTFKHALVRDTAYQSLLKSRRQQIHGRIAAALEAEFAEITEAEPETVAQHYTLAGLAGEGVPWWLRAGQRAMARSANREAAAHFAKGLELAASLPASETRLGQEVSLWTAMGSALVPAKGWAAPEPLQAFSTARELAARLGDKVKLFAAVRGESGCRTISGDLRAAEALAMQCKTLGMELAEASGDSEYLLEAHHQLWGVNFYLGRYESVESFVRYGLETYDYERHRHLAWGYTGHDPGVCCRSFHAQMLCICGKPDKAIRQAREAVALARRDSHPLSLAQAQMALGVVHLLRREPGEARGWTEKAIAVCTEFALPLLLGQARAFFGWALAGLGALDDGIGEMRDGIAAMAATGADMGMAAYLCALARACGERGEASEGLAVLEQAFDTLAKSGSTYQLPELLSAKGELLSRLDPRGDAAEDPLRQSLAAAREQGAILAELRAAFRLAGLWANHGRRKEARELLAPVYAAFNEGLDTPDLMEAGRLLQRLPQGATAVP